MRWSGMSKTKGFDSPALNHTRKPMWLFVNTSAGMAAMLLNAVSPSSVE